MSKIAGIIIKFFKNFLIKYLGTLVLEKILILLLEELVKRTDSDIDNKIYKIVFEKVENYPLSSCLWNRISQVYALSSGK